MKQAPLRFFALLVSVAAFSARAAVTLFPVTCLEWQEAALDEKIGFEIGEDAPLVKFGEINGRVAAFVLPADRELVIKLTSLIGDTVFCPSVLILDQRGQMIGRFGSSSFPYREERFLGKHRMEGKVSVVPPAGTESLRVVVFSATNDVAASTQLVSPAEVYASARSMASPGVKGRVAKHAETGSLTLLVEAGERLMLAPVVTEGPKGAEGVAGPADVTEPTRESREFYRAAIEQAVKANEIDRALGLLADAERVGVADARDLFVDALQRSRSGKSGVSAEKEKE